MRNFVLVLVSLALAGTVGAAVGRSTVHTPKPVVRTVDQVDSFNSGFLDGKADGLAQCQKGGH